MKKLFCAVLSVFILSSCNRVGFQPDFPLYTEGVAEVTLNGINCTAQLDFEADILNISFIQPDTLRNIKILVTSSEITVVNDSLRLKYDKVKVADLFLITQVYDVFKQLNSRKPIFNNINGKYEARFDINQNECRVLLDSQGEKLSEIKYKNLHLNFTV